MWKKSGPNATFRLIVMRIRFRAVEVWELKLYFYPSAVGFTNKQLKNTSFRFWSGRKNKTLSCKIETGFLCGDHARVIPCFARVIQQIGFRTRKNQAKVDYRYVRRRAEYTLLGPGHEHPSLRSDSRLAAKRRAEALHVVLFFQQSIRAQHESCCSVCTLA